MKLDYMEIALSALLGEIAQRSMSLFIDKLSREVPASVPSDENLRHKLLRVCVIVEEAEARQIRSNAMLEQLKLLQAEMYRGCYVLDTYKYQAYQEDYHGVSHSFALSKFNPTKRIRLYIETGSQGEKELLQMIGSLEIIITDVREFIMLLKGCPPLPHQVHSIYLVMEKCMFCRHVEMEQVINFLMQKGSLGTIDLGVLPIIGPSKVGKSTLIEHVCNDERVRASFSWIVFLMEDNFEERLTSIRDCGKHQSHDLDKDGERVLIIIEMNADINEDTWSSLYSASKRRATNGNKIIISSRSDRIARFGTTHALKLEYPTQEAYWYFFKALTFGSSNPNDEPELTSMAMEIAANLNKCLITGNILSRILRANFSTHFWRIVLSCVKEVYQRYCFKFGSHPIRPAQNRKQLRILNDSNDYCSILNDYQMVSAQDEAPIITFKEVWLGNVAPDDGKFDVLAWRSSIPPFCSYTCSCEIPKVPKLDVQKRIYTCVPA